MQQIPNPWREAIHRFIHDRLEGKLEVIEKDKNLDDDARATKFQSLREAHQPDTWLSDAALRAKQIQLATHTLKPIHPEAKGGSQLYSEGNAHAPLAQLGTHSLSRSQRPLDVVGNAAALDVFKLLKLQINSEPATLLDALTAGNVDALNADTTKANALAKALLAVTEPNDALASHALGKQLYFPTPDGDHLLAPLYPTQMAHAVHLHLQETRFGDAAKAARDAKKAGEFAPAYRDYPNLLTQAFGGTKPQNISQLNSERGGKSYLFPSLPPMPREFKGPPFAQDSVFAKNGSFAKRRDVRATLTELKSYLHDKRQRHPDDSRGGNKETRDFREESITRLMDSLIDFAAELRELAQGWSLDSRCELPLNQRYAFDPHAERPVKIIDPDFDFEDEPQVETPEKDWPRMLGRAFASFVTAGLSTKDNVMQSEEHQEWWRQTKRRLKELQKELADV
jgi:CRISPR-associated protein Csy1